MIGTKNYYTIDHMRMSSLPIVLTWTFFYILGKSNVEINSFVSYEEIGSGVNVDSL